MQLKPFVFFIVFAALLLLPEQQAFAFSQKAISAKACLLIDEQGRVLYEKNGSSKLPPASTVKLITAMVALDHLRPWMLVRVGSRAAAVRSIKPRLRNGDELTVTDLLHLTLIKSNNSAAVALAEAAAGSEERFVELMNQKARKIGATNTHFTNASGLPKGKQYTTARDLTVILKQALSYPLIKEIIGKKEHHIKTAAGREFHVENTDDLLWLREDTIGGKTGFTNNARHCFVGALNTDKGLLYAAVLGAPSRIRLWESAVMLAEYGTKPQPGNAVQTTGNNKYKYGFMSDALLEVLK